VANSTLLRRNRRGRDPNAIDGSQAATPTARYSSAKGSNMAQKLANVTGGMGGIGTAISRRLHQQGFRVVAGCSPRRDGARWVEQQRELGYTFHASVLDVADWDSSAAAFAAVVRDHGPVEVLVNNAGITRDSIFRKMSWEDWKAVIDTDLNSLFNVTRQVIDGMIERRWGRIINISSINGQRGQFGQVNYSAAKAGVHGFTMSLAQEVAAAGVTVNTVSPGYVGTEMVSAVRPDVLEKIIASIPVLRLGLPEEVASICGWIASDDSGFATGADFSLNGGLYMN
jgi:acetoacetyl-CoA reductase